MRLLATFVLIGFLLVGFTSAQEYPQWWLDYGVVPSQSPAAPGEANYDPAIYNTWVADNYAVANLGQAKNLASAARASMEVIAPGSSGSSIQNMVDAFSTAPEDNYVPLTIGQLKALSAPFYDQMHSLNIPVVLSNGTVVTSGNYPWVQNVSPENLALANLGQLKHLFAFDINSSNWVDGTDSDNDGIPDWWEGVNAAGFGTLELVDTTVAGGTYAFTVQLTNQDGSMREGGSILVVLLNGSGALSVSSIVSDTTGAASFDYTPNQYGRHEIQVVFIGARDLTLNIGLYVQASANTSPAVSLNSTTWPTDSDPFSEGAEPPLLVQPYSNYIEILPGEYKYEEGYENSSGGYILSEYMESYNFGLSVDITVFDREFDGLHDPDAFYYDGLADDTIFEFKQYPVRRNVMPRIPIITVESEFANLETEYGRYSSSISRYLLDVENHSDFIRTINVDRSSMLDDYSVLDYGRIGKKVSIRPGMWIFGFDASGYLVEEGVTSHCSFGESTQLKFQLPAGYTRDYIIDDEDSLDEESQLYWTFEAVEATATSASLESINIETKLHRTVDGGEPTSDIINLSIGEKVRMLDPEDGTYTHLEFEVLDGGAPSGSFLIRVGAELDAPDGETHSLGTQQIRYIIPDGSQPFEFPVDESAGPKYRKIALNGRPIPDEKPQAEAETDQEPEGTYIDALSLGLRHSVTDIYVPVPASDLALSVRRNTAPEIWSLSGGLRPSERPDLPFGVAWSTNLVPNLKLSLSNYDGTNSLPSEPDTATVLDENGESFTYIISYGSGALNSGDFSPTISDINSFSPRPNGRNNQQAYLNTLTRTGVSTFRLSKRFGTTVDYELVSALSKTTASSRIKGSKISKNYYYARAVRVTDRYGNCLIYEYDGNSLIPRIVAFDSDSDDDADDESLRILVGYSNGRVDRVVDPRNHVVDYTYGVKGINLAVLSEDENALSFNPNYYVLSEVTHADESHTVYDYYVPSPEVDTLSSLNGDPYHHFHVYLDSITDGNGNTYGFNYSKQGQYFSNNTAYGHYQPSGRSWKVASVDLPGIAGSSNVTFSDNSNIKVDGTSLLTGSSRQTVVTDAEGNTVTYDWPIADAFVEALPDLSNSYGTDAEDFSTPLMIYFGKMQLTHSMRDGPDLTEIFEFDVNAGMSLSRTVDISNNETAFEHVNQLPVSAGLYAAYYPEPTTQTNALFDEKEFLYQMTGGGRIMKAVLDEEGRLTAYDVDATTGLRLHEYIYGSDQVNSINQATGSYTAAGRLIQHTEFVYGNSKYPAFMTKRIVHSHASDSNLPSDPTWSTGPVPQQVTLFEPYTSGTNEGRVHREAVDMDGNGTITTGDLITVYEYDANGNRTRSIDPKGNSSWYIYDARNRMTEVVYADGSNRTIQYDDRGNRVVETDENGHKTGHEYDALNRKVRTIRDMNGNLFYDENQLDQFTGDGGPDLITTFEYNDVNSLVVTVDPRGFGTRNVYDNLQRVTKTIVPAAERTAPYTPSAISTSDSITAFDYEAVKNPGSGVFNNSGFKPTRVTDPRGFETQMTYDELYRLVESKVEYESDLFATTSHEYDAVGNKTAQVDPLLKRSETVYDALNRPVATTVAHGTTDAFTTLTRYTSSGFAYQSVELIDGSYNPASDIYSSGANDRKTDSEYDRAGRIVRLEQPSVYDALSGASGQRPVTLTVYDANGNPIESINPLGYTWETYYDNRNRPVASIAPGSFDSGSMEWGHARTDTFYDAVGNVISVIDPRGFTSYTNYDAANRPVLSVSPEVTLADESMVYPASRNTYDSAGNILTTEQGTVDDPQLLTPVFTAARTNVINTYDALGRIATSTDAENITVTNEYDEVGNRTAVIDGKLQRTEFEYDGLNRNTAVFNGFSGAAFVDATVNLYNSVNMTDRYRGVTALSGGLPSDGEHTAYEYDSRHRLLTVDYTAVSGIDRHYHYDKVGNILVVDEPETLSDVAYVYDKLNRIRAEFSTGIWHTYEYDLAGNRLYTNYDVSDPELVSPESLLISGVDESVLLTGSSVVSARQIHSKYDSNNRTDSLAENGRVSRYRYDLAGNLLQKMQPNGDTIHKAYDALGRTTMINGPGLHGAELYTVSNAYDLYGNLARITENYPAGELSERTIINSYDGANRLRDEQITVSSGTVITTYAYDAAHNRILRAVDADGSETFSVGDEYTRSVYTNSLNQPDYSYIDANNNGAWDLGEQRTEYVYDNKGNRSTSDLDSDGDGITDELTVYTYDAENRLLQLTNTQGLYVYAYDYRTRRVLRDESGAGGGSTQVVFSGGTSVQEYDDAATAPTVEYIRGSDYGGGIGGILYTLRSGFPSFKHYNSRGDVVAATDASGSLTYQAAYEAFGKHGDTDSSQEWGSTLDRQQANTKDEDPTGLLNEGFRYRDLETGTFITRDPLGFVDGPNVYTYVVQNPWTKFDPLGLKTVSEYDEEIEHHSEQQNQARDRIAELKEEGNWKDRTPAQNREMLKLHGALRKHGNAKREAEEGRNNIFESAKNIHDKLGVAIDPMSIDDEDSHYQSVTRSMGIIDWVPGSSTAYAVNRGDKSGAAKAFATEVAVTYLGGKLIQKGFGSVKPNVFWSGSPEARMAAEGYALASGGQTLEMTLTGKALDKITTQTTYPYVKPLWDAASRNFARGATGTAEVFQSSQGVRLQSVWRNVEYPQLMKQGTPINYNVTK